MSRTRSRIARGLLAGALAAGLTAGATLAAGAPASAASAGFIAAPNTMVGVAAEIVVYAPKSQGQVVTLGAQVGGFSTTMQTTIGSNGYGSVSWLPASAGTWTFNGLGTIASLGSTSASVVAMPTYTVLLAQNNVTQGRNNNVLATVIAPIGSLAPTGTVTLQTGGTLNAISNATLTATSSPNISQATLGWTPTTGGPQAVQAMYTPASAGQSGSTSPISNPTASTAIQAVAMRWPETLYVGEPTLLQAVLGYGYPQGTVAWTFDNAGISGSIPTTDSVAGLQWTPPAGGVHTIAVSYTGAVPNTNPVSYMSGTSTQTVNIQGARPTDNITVQPAGQAPWNIAQPIAMQAGSSLMLAGTSQSGTPVIFSEQGPCVISGATLTALSAGQCQVTAISPGNAGIKPGSETYTITVTKAPKKKKK